MNSIAAIRSVREKIEHWTNQHHTNWLDYLRILLGIVLLIKGITFIANKEQVIQIISNNEFWVFHYIIAHYVIGGYIVCGTAIIIGLFTRLVVLFEIPALLGSIIFVDMHKGLLAINFRIGLFNYYFGASFILSILWIRKNICRLLYPNAQG